MTSKSARVTHVFEQWQAQLIATTKKIKKLNISEFKGYTLLVNMKKY
jgi:hypothetical protein